MPESPVRRKAPYIPPPGKAAAPKPNPRWFVPLMVGLLVLGLVYLVVSYLAEFRYPVPGIDYWNLGIGFAILMAGFVMTTRWR